MGGQGPDTILVPDRDDVAAGDFANATELEIGEALFPGIQQRNGLATGDGKKQFEILAIGQSCKQGRFG
jgi:hypothetical protein